MDQLVDATTSGSIEVVSSQHAAYNTQQKALGKQNFQNTPEGITGVEERLMIVWQKGVNSGKMSRSQFVQVTSSTPAKLLNIYPQKGRIAVGSDADIVIWDPAATKIIT